MNSSRYPNLRSLVRLALLAVVLAASAPAWATLIIIVGSATGQRALNR